MFTVLSSQHIHYFFLQSVSICLNISVCLSTGISLKHHVQTSQNVLYMLPVAVAWSSSDNNVILCVLYVHDVTFSDNGTHFAFAVVAGYMTASLNSARR